MDVDSLKIVIRGDSDWTASARAPYWKLIWFDQAGQRYFRDYQDLKEAKQDAKSLRADCTRKQVTLLGWTEHGRWKTVRL